MVAQWLAHWLLVLEVPGSIPEADEKSLVSEHAPLRVIDRGDINTVRRPSDRDGNWSPVCRLKNPILVI